MLGKLNDLGNSLLGNFGLSTDKLRPPVLSACRPRGSLADVLSRAFLPAASSSSRTARAATR